MLENMTLRSSVAHHLCPALRIVFVLCAGVACSSAATPYDRLCRIYEEFDGRPTSSEIAVAISMKVEKQVPEIYDDYHVVMSSGSAERYEMFRMLARERVHQANWTCEAIRRRYPPDSPQ